MFPRDHRFIDDLQIGDIYLGAKDSHLYEKISFRIWKRTYGSGQIEAEHFYSLAEFEITWLMLFFRFFRVKLHTGSGLLIFWRSRSRSRSISAAEIFSFPNLRKFFIVSSATSFASRRIAFAFSFASLIMRSLRSSRRSCFCSNFCFRASTSRL